MVSIIATYQFLRVYRMLLKLSIKLSSYRPDHSAMEIKFNSFTRGHGLWKFDNSLLRDEVYVEKAKQTIQLVEEIFLINLTINGNDLYYFYFDKIDNSTFFEVLLMEIRETTI